MTLFLVSDQIVNLDNVVSLDIDNRAIVRVWYIGSSSPITLQPPVNVGAVINELRRLGLIRQ
jgi:hypothetical protein